MNNAVRYQVMPPLSSEEYQDLFESIKAEGVLEPIHVDEEGVVIDGHHRSKIASELGIPCPVITHDDLNESGKRSLAFTLNLKRRHLNREQRRALREESLKRDPQLSNREHARRTGADHKTVVTDRERLEALGEIPQVDKTTDSMGREWKVDRHAAHPEPAPAPGFNPGDLDELNTPSPFVGQETKAEPPKPRRTPITDEVWEAILGIKKAITKLTETASDDRFAKNKTQIAELASNDLGLIIESIAEYRDNLK